ncbi:MAG: sigma-70 family RNA polymerase sigma factor [Thermoleophilia bacterium]|nr:sigma-70 family RNA polymerase sigma factor [Thermoleophilia bacterium]
MAIGDHTAFEALYDEFADLVFSIALGMLNDRGRAEDAAQDVWVKLWNAAGSFDGGRSSVATWVTTLAHRHVIDLIRRSNVRVGDRTNHEPGDEIAERLDAGSDTEHDAVVSVMGDDARRALAELPPLQAEAIGLAYFGGFSQSEIAAKMQKPLGTVKTYMFQGMRTLRDLLDVNTTSTNHTAR